MKGPKAKYPQPTPQETELQNQQIQLLRMQLAEYQKAQQQYAQWLPLMYGKMGYKEGPGGEPVKLSEEEMLAYYSPYEREQYEIGKLASARERKALEGKLDISPAVETSLGETKAALQERLARQLGPGWETSSPGIEALGEYEKNAEALREAIRTGEMGQMEGIAGARTGLTQTALADIAAPFQTQSQLAQLMQGGGSMGGMLGQMGAERAQRANIYNQAAMSSAQNRSNLMGAGLGLAGAALAGYYTMGAGAPAGYAAGNYLGNWLGGGGGGSYYVTPYPNRSGYGRAYSTYY